MRDAAGFSLIEVLVVVAITSTLALAATLSWGRGDTGPDISARFEADISRVQRTAMLLGVDHRMVFSPSGWHIERADLDGWSKLPLRAQKARVTAAPAQLLLPADGRTAVADTIFETASGPVTCRTRPGQPPRCAGA